MDGLVRDVRVATAAPGRAGVPRASGATALPSALSRAGLAARLAQVPPALVVWAAAGFLVAFGLLMVLSASSVESTAEHGTPFVTAGRQALFALAAVPLAVLASRVPVRWWRRLAWPLVLAALALQALVFSPLGFEVNGNRNWIRLGPVTVQPAEALKLALVVWGAHVLTTKAHLLHRLGHLAVPLLPVALAGLGLVLAGRDAGSALVLGGLLAGMLLAAGVRFRHLLLGAAVAAAGLAALVLSADYRRDRVEVWLSGECAEYYGTCWQPTHGMWALASGGWWGLGPGASLQKWAWLPEAHNDFIFAIIGEELGLPGTLTILALFAFLVAGATAIARGSRDAFVATATAGVVAWLGGQALLNIGVVLGFLPVTGVPLPLVSSGGSSLVVSLVAVGMLVSFARDRGGGGRRRRSPVPTAARTTPRTTAGATAATAGATGRRT